MTRQPHQYGRLPKDQQDALMSNFLISSWSYSKVNTFARNQLAFEMQYVYGLYGRSGASSMAGKAYHKALEVYFTQMKDGVHIPLPELDACAFQLLEEIPANQWKLGKTTPTMEQAMSAALKTSNKLLRNFYSERSEYEDDIAEVLAVELKFTVWVAVNGVDIPLPLTVVIDMVVRTKKGKIAIVDHKSKGQYTDLKAEEMVIGPQAITYAIAYEAYSGQQVDEVWFMENKYSQNQDGRIQINAIKKALDKDRRTLWETLLYGNLRQMIAAVKDPDHIYTYNISDNLVDMAEMEDFYYRTMIGEIEDFNVEGSKKQLVAKRLRKIKDSNIQSIPISVIRAFKEKAATFIQYDYSVLNMSQPQKIEHVLKSFNVMAQVAHKFEGYSSDTYLLEVSAGVKVGSVYKYRLDIANALNVENVRMSSDLVVFEKKSYLSIECTKERDKTLFFNPDELDGYKIPLGHDNFGNKVFWDLYNQSTPNMLVCGAVGSGKSVHIINIIEYAKLAGIDEIVIFDPKYEFTKYGSRKIIVLNEISEIEAAMGKLVDKMNERIARQESKITLVIFDEFADAVDRARKGKELYRYEAVEVGTYASGMPKIQERHVATDKSLEENLKILLQKGRSSGFRIVAAAQRASVGVIRGDAKVNFPVRVCFYVPKAADSMVILDEAGAEALTGKGDGLISSPEYRDTVRFQAYYKPQTQPA